jgi:hypothetical protein
LRIDGEASVKAIAISTFHASGRQVEAAMLADQRHDIESDLALRLGELTGMMPYAVNRVRAPDRRTGRPARTRIESAPVSRLGDRRDDSLGDLSRGEYDGGHANPRQYVTQ